MATRPQFNDSSGDEVDVRQKVPQPLKGRLPEALELKDLSCTPLSRDSGCFTGSPMTATRGERPDTVGNNSHFTFEDSPTTADSLVFSSSTPLGDSGTHSLPGYGHSDDLNSDDDVFHSSESFLDSGIQALEFEDCTDDRQGEISSDTELDEVSSTSSAEFGTVEFDLMGDSPVSSPIDIPARRSHNSSPGVDDESDEEEVFSAAVESPPLSRLLRRATIGQINPRGAPISRPQSEDGRVQGNAGRGQFFSQSVEGAAGPLPDVVPSALGRCRAMSESAIMTRQVQRVGVNLREISDEFSDRRLQRQRNQLHLIQQRQQSPNHVRVQRPTQSDPAANQNRDRNRSNSFLTSLQQRFFSSSQE